MSNSFRRSDTIRNPKFLRGLTVARQSELHHEQRLQNARALLQRYMRYEVCVLRGAPLNSRRSFIHCI